MIICLFVFFHPLVSQKQQWPLPHDKVMISLFMTFLSQSCHKKQQWLPPHDNMMICLSMSFLPLLWQKQQWPFPMIMWWYAFSLLFSPPTPYPHKNNNEPSLPSPVIFPVVSYMGCIDQGISVVFTYQSKLSLLL